MSPIRFLSNAMEKICDIFSTEREVYPSTMAFNEARRNPKKYSGTLYTFHDLSPY